jgi:hypothetical protein
MTDARAAAESNQWGMDMRKLLATAGVGAVLVLSAAPAQAAASQAGATARIYRPLALSSDQNMDLGIIVLSGTTFSGQSVVMNTAGTITTCGSGGNLTCSGATTAARYTVTGAANQTVTVSAPAFTLAPAAANLILTPNAPATVNTGVNGNSTGVTFTIGGTLSGLANTTPDGTYTGTFAVTVAYQ